MNEKNANNSRKKSVVVKIKNSIPNTITSLNLFSGAMAVYYGFQNNYETVLLFILLASVFDFLDGFAARLLKAYSPLGKELDSLADMVSFGLAPGVVAFALLRESALPEWAAFAGFIIPVFSALRLAKFNIDERQTTSFIGMPTPANAIFWIGLGYSFSDFMIENYWITIILILIMSSLLVVELPMFSLKFKNLKWKENSWQFIFLGVCVILLIFLKLNAFAPIISWYIILSIIKRIFN
ncbi:MAG: CDP-diacylglycerol--serine O-phosphatidyltransferase [Paludibacter sp.]|nr:CDP-diacylglycerol--serine O-phosphatidyltransferase [Paludibacter sp.]